MQEVRSGVQCIPWLLELTDRGRCKTLASVSQGRSTDDQVYPRNRKAVREKITMNRPKKTIFALLAIAASVGNASLIVTPPRGYQVALSEEEFRRLQVPLPKQGDEFSHDVFLYRISRWLPSDHLGCGFTYVGLTEKQIQAKQQAIKERDARVIAQAKRQEAQEARLKGNQGIL